ncbi:MAG: adenylate/guanylate cyclase domain-containing protein [Pseudomonadota bacterium]
MQHKDRKTFIDVIGRSVDDLRGTGFTAEDRQLWRQRFSELLDEFLLESQPINETDATILLADIRGFTSLTRALSPDLVANLLNRYFAVMCEVIQRHGGTVDKFMGDSIMALFGAPDGSPDDLHRALCCAVEMQQAMLTMNRDNKQEGLPGLFAGIAINTGTVLAGSFGSEVHSEYTVIGDAVNLAARIESFSLRGQVLLSEAVKRAAGPDVTLGSANHVCPKGFAEGITLHELLSVQRDGTPLKVPDVEVRRSPRIAVDIDAMFREVRDKQVAPDMFAGHVNDMGYYGMCADLPLTLADYSEVSMTVEPQLGLESASEVYARVIRSRPEGSGYRTSMEFTTVETPAHQRLKEYVDYNLWHRGF